MVVVNEMNNTFWGVTLNEGKRYSQNIATPVHVSMAALEPGSNKAEEGPVSVMIQHEKSDFLLCSLGVGQTFQQSLDLNFNEGEEVTFYLKGKGIVHLTGYVISGDDYDSASDEDFLPSSFAESDDESVDSDLDDEADVSADGSGSKKRKKILPAKESKKQKVEIIGEDDDFDDDDEDDSMDDYSVDDDDDDDDDSSGMIDDEAEEDNRLFGSDDDESEEDSDDEPAKKVKQTPSSKKANKAQEKPTSEKKKPEKAKEKAKSEPKSGKSESGTPALNESQESSQPGTSEKKKKKKKKNKKKSETSQQESAASSNEKEGSAKPQQKEDSAPPSTRKVQGVTMHDLKVGHGPEAKVGSKVLVYYTGKLPNGKVFDSVTSGKPMRVKLGKQEVIKGFDIGIQGMKVGGKRKVIIPPKMGYGSQTYNTIPGNSTLQFELELKAVE